jgi:hypothetical protein
VNPSITTKRMRLGLCNKLRINALERSADLTVFRGYKSSRKF